MSQKERLICRIMTANNHNNHNNKSIIMTLARFILLAVNLGFIKTNLLHIKIRQHGKVALINVAQTLNCSWKKGRDEPHT